MDEDWGNAASKGDARHGKGRQQQLLNGKSTLDEDWGAVEGSHGHARDGKGTRPVGAHGVAGKSALDEDWGAAEGSHGHARDGKGTRPLGAHGVAGKSALDEDWGAAEGSHGHSRDGKGTRPVGAHGVAGKSALDEDWGAAEGAHGHARDGKGTRPVGAHGVAGAVSLSEGKSALDEDWGAAGSHGHARDGKGTRPVGAHGVAGKSALDEDWGAAEGSHGHARDGKGTRPVGAHGVAGGPSHPSTAGKGVQAPRRGVVGATFNADSDDEDWIAAARKKRGASLNLQDYDHIHNPVAKAEEILKTHLAFEPIDEEQLQLLFSIFDADKNGFISKEEFRLLYQTLDQMGCEGDAIGSLLTKYNMLGDDRLSYTEFCILICKLLGL